MKKNKDHLGKVYVEKDMVAKISERTGIGKMKVNKILSVFRFSFKKYLKGPMELPVHIESVFKAYRGKSKKQSTKTEEQRKNWRETDKSAPYKK